MTIYAIRLTNNHSELSLSSDLFIGKLTRLIGTSEGGLLLFSAKEKATKYAEGIIQNDKFDIITPSSSIGVFLATNASVDHFNSAFLDIKIPIIFLSCTSGSYVLPSHFYKQGNEGLESLWNDDQWHTEEIDLECPTCPCRGMLGPYFPSSLDFPNKKAIPSLYQAIAGSHTSFDGTSCNSLVVIDLKPPKNSFFMEILLCTEDGELSLFYHLTPKGFACIEPEEENTSIVPWEICPLSGLVRIGIPNISSHAGLKYCEIFLCERKNESFALNRIDSTGKAMDIPMIEYESISSITSGILKNFLRKA